MNFLLIPSKVSERIFVPEKTKVAISKIFFYICTRDRDSFIESMETVTPSQKDYFFENLGRSVKPNQDCSKISSALKKVLESIALGNFDRKTLKADVDIKEFDQDLSDVLQGHLKSNISLVTLVEYILVRIDEGISLEDFKLNLGLNSIPQILLTIVDYVTDYFKLSDDRTKLEKMIFRTMHKICEESSSVLS